VDGECDVETIGSLLQNATARTILLETSQTPMSASTLSERCEASRPTIYRRLEDLRECGLLVERTRLDPDEGHHRTVYVTNLRRITVHLDDGTMDLQVDRKEDIADRFTRLVEGM